MTYGGLVFDLLVPFGLLAESDAIRRIAVLGTWLFHGINFFIFDIGIFPLLGSCCSVLFLPKNDVQYLLRALTKLLALLRCGAERKGTRNVSGTIRYREAAHTRVALLLAAYAAVQIALPLRHYWYHFSTNQSVNWTSEGEWFSWRMMLTSKNCSSGYFLAVSEAGRSVVVEPRVMGLAVKQEWGLFQRPAHVVQGARFVRALLDSGGLYSLAGGDVPSSGRTHLHGDSSASWVTAHVYAIVNCTLNQHPSQQYIDPSIDILGWKQGSQQRLWLPQREFAGG